jgi:carbamoyltransferase
MAEHILGIHFGHDATVTLMKDGQIIESMSEERLSRIKKYVGFPHLSLKYIKEKYGIETFPHVFVNGLEFGGHAFETYESNKKYRENPPQDDWFLRAVGARFPFIQEIYRVFDILRFSKNMVNMEHKTRAFLKEVLPGSEFHFIHHHLAHAYATIPFMPNTKDKRLVLTLDGQGDDLSGSINLFENGEIQVLHRIPRQNSLGLLYSSIVDILGMARNEHEFKVMGLAPYAKKSSGEKVYAKLKELVWFDENEMVIKTEIDTRRATGYLIAHDFCRYRFDSLAYGIQKLTEEVMKDMVRASIKKYGCGDIAVGGGVFMNVKANQYVSEMPEVTSLVIAPSCGDESLSIGDVVYGYSQLHNKDLSNLKLLHDLYLGSEYSDEEIRKAIDAYAYAKVCDVTYFDPKSENPIEKKVAEILADNDVVGRLKGRSEWGARALGNRSILANPSSRDNVKLINEMIKGRDFWMPFATSMKYERRNDYLENPRDMYAPYMAITFNTKPIAHKELIAALHPYDLTSRPQMVKKEVNHDYHTLISYYEDITGSGGILNTSFNLHGEPNVENPYDALRTFELSGLKHLALGNYLISKK